MSNAPAVNYNDLEAQKKLEIQGQIQRRLKDKVQYGDSGGFRQVILRLVVDGLYARAAEELDRYIENKSKYPRFDRRVKPFKNHSKDLIFAIESKRHFPGLSQLSSSKHQELFDKVVEHFEELKNILIKIEIVEKEEKLKDLKSTVMVLKTAWICIFAIFGILFAQSLVTDGLASSMEIVFDETFGKTLEKVFAVF